MAMDASPQRDEMLRPHIVTSEESPAPSLVKKKKIALDPVFSNC